MPSVTTSMRVLAPLSRPSARASRCARRQAPIGLRHARGGGSRSYAARLQHQDLATPRQPSSIKANGTRVVLPAPGGADTADGTRQAPAQVVQDGVDRQRVANFMAEDDTFVAATSVEQERAAHQPPILRRAAPEHLCARARSCIVAVSASPTFAKSPIMPLTRFEITSRAPYAGADASVRGAYEQVDGTAHFAVDQNPAKALICDLKLAPRNAAGLSSSRPISPSCCQWTPPGERPLHRRAAQPRPARRRPDELRAARCPVGPQAHPGDGFLFARGYTVASIGWHGTSIRAPSCWVSQRRGHAGRQAHRRRDDGRDAAERARDDAPARRPHPPAAPAAPASSPARPLVRDWEERRDR